MYARYIDSGHTQNDKDFGYNKLFAYIGQLAWAVVHEPLRHLSDCRLSVRAFTGFRDVIDPVRYNPTGSIMAQVEDGVPYLFGGLF